MSDSTEINDEAYMSIISKMKEFTKEDFTLAQQKGVKFVIYIGKSGAGKSTLVNLQAGNNLIMKKLKISGQTLINEGVEIIINDDEIEIFETEKDTDIRIYHGEQSGTTIPKKYYDETSNTLHIDCSGFEDNRGPEQDIPNSFFISSIFEGEPKLIKIVLVIPESDFQDSKATDILKVTNQFCEMFNNFKCVLPSCCLVVSKTSVITHTDIIKKLGRLSILNKISKDQIHLFKHFHDETHKVVFFPSFDGSIETKHSIKKAIDSFEFCSIDSQQISISLCDNSKNLTQLMFCNFSTLANTQMIKMLDYLKETNDDKKDFFYFKKVGITLANFLQEFQNSKDDVKIDSRLGETLSILKFDDCYCSDVIININDYYNRIIFLKKANRSIQSGFHEWITKFVSMRETVGRNLISSFHAKITSCCNDIVKNLLSEVKKIVYEGSNSKEIKEKLNFIKEEMSKICYGASDYKCIMEKFIESLDKFPHNSCFADHLALIKATFEHFISLISIVSITKDDLEIIKGWKTMISDELQKNIDKLTKVEVNKNESEIVLKSSIYGLSELLEKYKGLDFEIKSCIVLADYFCIDHDFTAPGLNLSILANTWKADSRFTIDLSAR